MTDRPSVLLSGHLAQKVLYLVTISPIELDCADEE